MSRRSLNRVLALGVLVVLVALDGVLIARLPPAIKSALLFPRPAPSAAPPNTTAPPTRGSTVGTYWTCASNESDNGSVVVEASPPAGGVPDSFCDDNFGRKAPGQKQPAFPSGIEFWRVPVGTFTPYVRCGVEVTNVEDPYDPQAAPGTWPTSHKLLLDSDRKTVESGGVCPNPHPATKDPGPNVGTYWTCGSNETDNGTAIADAPAPAGGVPDSFCDDNFGRKAPGQKQPDSPSDIEFWRVPVGTFTPYVRCGVKVTDIEDPYDPQAAPRTWSTSHTLLLDSDRKTVESGGVCPNPHPATKDPGPNVGTYWTCGSNETDNGTAIADAPAPVGGVPDSFCDDNFGRKAPGQKQPDSPSDIEFWRVPVGTFTPYVRCGVKVTDIEDPYDPQSATWMWPTSHTLLLDSDRRTVESGGVCPNPHPARTAPGPNVGTYWTCGSNETDNGTAIADAPAPVGGVPDSFCDDNFGRKAPGQKQPDFSSDIRFWRVPVGTFTPYFHCGVKVTNIEDPYDPQAAPRTWPASHKRLLDANWNVVRSGRC